MWYEIIATPPTYSSHFLLGKGRRSKIQTAPEALPFRNVTRPADITAETSQIVKEVAKKSDRFEQDNEADAVAFLDDAEDSDGISIAFDLSDDEMDEAQEDVVEEGVANVKPTVDEFSIARPEIKLDAATSKPLLEKARGLSNVQKSVSL